MKKCCKNKVCVYSIKKPLDRKITEWVFDHPILTTIIISIPTFALVVVMLIKNNII